MKEKEDCCYYHYVVAHRYGTSSDGHGCLNSGGRCQGLCESAQEKPNKVEFNPNEDWGDYYRDTLDGGGLWGD